MTIKRPNKLKSIEGKSFRKCSNLKKLVIPKKVKYFGSVVFEYSTISSIKNKSKLHLDSTNIGECINTACM